MIDLGQYDAIKREPNDDDGVFRRFRERMRLALLEEEREGFWEEAALAKNNLQCK